MTSQKLSQAISLIKAGNKKAAMPILKEILQSEPNNEKAWIAMYTGVDNPKHKKMCLQKILAINPNNQGARKALANMERRSKPVAPIPQQPVRSSQPKTNSYPQHPNRPVAQKKKQTPKKKVTKKNNNLLIGAIVIFALFCLGGVFLGGKFVVGKLNNSNSSASGDTYTPSIDNGESYSQVGVFLENSGQLTKMEHDVGDPPPSGVPQTDNKTPSFVLNDPGIYPPDLIFGQYYDGRLRGELPYSIYEEGGAYQVKIDRPLEDGVYCFGQYGPMVAPGQPDMWCVQIGNNDVVPTPTSPDIRISTHSYQKNDSKKTGWSTLTVNLYIENHSQKPLVFYPNRIEIHTSGGFEYICKEHFPNIDIAPPYVFIPPDFRAFYTFECDVSTNTQGYQVFLSYQLQNHIKGALFLPELSHGPIWENLVEVSLDENNPNLPFLMISPTSYSVEDTTVILPNQPAFIGDILISVDTSAVDLPYYEGPVLALKIKNESVGYDAKVYFKYFLFSPDGEYDKSYAVRNTMDTFGPEQSGLIDIVPGSRDNFSMNSTYPYGTCMYAYDIEINDELVSNIILACLEK